MIRCFALCIVVVLSIVSSGCKTTNKINFSTVEQHYSTASQVYQRGDLHTAEGYLQKVIKAQPNHQESWCLLGHVYYRLNSYEAADNAYQTCLLLRAEQPEIWHNLAAVKLRQATELLITGLPYLEIRDSDEKFTTNYHLLLKELARLHGVSNLNMETRVGH